MRAPTASARNEYAFILCAIGAGSLPDKADALAVIAARGLYWKRVLRRARLHGVSSMLADSLQSLPPGSVPPFASDWLAGQRVITTTRSVFLTSQLARIIPRFDADGIEALPFKGPTLAALAYGDVGLRVFSDLDILVKPAQVQIGRAHV